MADRRDFYFRQKVSEAELDDAFSDLETADRAITSDLDFVGIARGLAVAQQATPNLTVQVSGGVAYDQLGQRLSVPAPQNVNCAVDEAGLNTAVVTPGSSRILSIFLEFDRILSDPRVDGNGATVFFERTESFRFNVVAGAEAVSPAPPPLRGDQILLADITLTYGQASILDANISNARRQVMFRTTTGTPIAAGTVKEALQVLADTLSAESAGLSAHIVSTSAHASTSITMGSGPAWADGTANGAGNVGERLNKIISDLAAPAGSDRVGASAYASSAFELEAGSVQYQLRLLADAVSDFRRTRVFLNHTSIAGAGAVAGNWSIGGIGGNDLTSSADGASVRIYAPMLPPGCRIEAVNIRIDPGGTRPAGSRTQAALGRMDTNGGSNSILALTENPEANGDSMHTWTIPVPTHFYSPDFLYYVTLLSGTDGGAHQPDRIVAVYLTLGY